MRVAPNTCLVSPRRLWALIFGVPCFVVFTIGVAVVKNQPLWALWSLFGVVPFGVLFLLPQKQRRQLFVSLFEHPPRR
jgi:hypothetical protein